MTKANKEIPFWEKYTLTIEEASIYFGIGDKKIRWLVNDIKGTGDDFTIFNGTKCLINKKKFELFLDKVTSI